MILATLSKHDIAGIIVLLVGIVVLGIGIVRAAVRTAMLLTGVIVVVLGALLLTRTI